MWEQALPPDLVVVFIQDYANCCAYRTPAEIIKSVKIGIAHDQFVESRKVVALKTGHTSPISIACLRLRIEEHLLVAIMPATPVYVHPHDVHHLENVAAAVVGLITRRWATRD